MKIIAILQGLGEDIQGYWAEILLGVAAVVKGAQWIGEYLASKNSDTAAVKMAAIENDKELAEKYKNVVAELHKTQIHLNRSVVIIETIMPMLRDKFKDEPGWIDTLNMVEENLKSIKSGTGTQ